MSASRTQILVPVDFGEQSQIALKQSFNLAKLTNAELTLVNVIDDDTISSVKDLMEKGYNIESQLRADMFNKLRDLASEIEKDTGLRVNISVRTGKIYEEIAELASEIDASMIIMGTQGPVGLKKRFLGSNASRVVRGAACPVITIKGKQHRPGCKHILLPLDLTKETKEKVNKAIEFARLFNSEIHIVTIVKSDDEFIMNKLTRQMEQVKAFIVDEGFPCTSEFIDGDEVAEEVIKAASSREADLIMIMTQQEVGWVDLFLAPSAMEIINLSEIPVLSIRPMSRKNTSEFVIS